MSFLDKAKEKAQQLVETAKDKVDDFKESRKAEDLLADLGRISFRSHTGRPEVGDQAATDKLVNELKALEAEGAQILPKAAEPDASESSTDAPASSPTSSGDDAPPPATAPV